MNTDWHDAHVLGMKAPIEERVRWHLQHAAKCACRPIPTDVQDAIDAQAHQGASA
ncbi:MAG: hypothetical protein ABJA16_09440 [Nakamurella sp.]